MQACQTPSGWRCQQSEELVVPPVLPRAEPDLISSRRYSTVSTLLQYYLFIPLSQKDVHLVYLANSLAQNSIMVFTRTVHDAQRYVLAPPPFRRTCGIRASTRLSIVLHNLGFSAIPLHGQLSQSQRLGSLSKFQSGSRKILVATDVASR